MDVDLALSPELASLLKGCMNVLWASTLVLLVAQTTYRFRPAKDACEAERAHLSATATSSPSGPCASLPAPEAEVSSSRSASAASQSSAASPAVEAPVRTDVRRPSNSKSAAASLRPTISLLSAASVLSTQPAQPLIHRSVPARVSSIDSRRSSWTSTASSTRPLLAC